MAKAIAKARKAAIAEAAKIRKLLLEAKYLTNETNDPNEIIRMSIESSISDLDYCYTDVPVWP